MIQDWINWMKLLETWFYGVLKKKICTFAMNGTPMILTVSDIELELKRKLIVKTPLELLTPAVKVNSP